MSVGDSPPATDDPLISQLVADRYRIIRKLGEGGMGSVYLAEHIVIEKKFALKVLAPELARRADLVARFLQEARSASRIGHENVIDISDFGQSPDGLVYIAMEFLDGEDLGQIARTQGAMDWNDARGIVLQICRALRAAHDKGIVHRDMKPENIFLIQREGQPHFVKILDFGIAKVMGLDPNGPRLTRTGMIFGTPEYMAPEQAEGKDTDHRADIYAVGCIMYHLITGQTPFVAESFMTMLTKHLMEDPVPPSVRRPDLTITPEMDVLVLKALEEGSRKALAIDGGIASSGRRVPWTGDRRSQAAGGANRRDGRCPCGRGAAGLACQGQCPRDDASVEASRRLRSFRRRYGCAAGPRFAQQDPRVGDCRHRPGRRGCDLVRAVTWESDAAATRRRRAATVARRGSAGPAGSGSRARKRGCGTSGCGASGGEDESGAHA